MKLNNLITIAFSLLLVVAISTPIQAQMSPKEKRQLEREADYNKDVAKSQTKAAKKLLKKKADKNARKEAKKLRKQDYVVFPGSVPMAKQLESCWMKQLEQDDRGAQKYIFSDGNGVANTQTAAEMQAMEAAKLQLAGQISNEINQIVESKIANEQISREEAQSLTKFVAGGKNYIIQSLSYVRPAFKVMREVGRSNVEVTLKLFYSVEEAMEATKKALEAKARADLEGEADELIDQIDKLFKK